MDAMEKINVAQLEIEQHHFENQNHNFKKHLHYLKVRNKKMHQMNDNMVNVISNSSMAMCHAFITYQRLMPPLIVLPNSLNEKEENIIKRFHEVFQIIKCNIIRICKALMKIMIAFGS